MSQGVSIGLPIVSAVVFGACAPHSPSGAVAGEYEVRDTTVYENHVEIGRLGVLFRNGTYVDSIDVDFGLQPLQGDTVLVLPVRSAVEEGGGLLGIETFATEPVLLGRWGRTPLKDFLPLFHSFGSAPTVLDGQIHYWGIEQLPAGEFRLLAMRFDPQTERVDSVFLATDALATDDRFYLLPPEKDGGQLVYSGANCRWVLDSQYRIRNACTPA